ncbi:Homoserine kinase [Pseudovibrio axinellae]|uniref:Homoserine kinase n=1 Tax=Pseudovibrio axinellae TaxID=989403 RepID=A0A165YEH7_9HYPH|nr:homoserine kinase [Pseudovibrio axinellae]KZL18772.1 Homoserine kinase [Pseudovibrio axinellae]SEP93386.1 homoserine kinase [Pseudovibrio axinellae]
MAVYTDVSDEELGAFIDRFNIGNLLSYKGIAEGVENSNYLVHTQTGYYILTLYEKRVDPEDLPFFLGLMQHLAAKGLNCPTPLINRDGKMLGELAGRPAAMVTFLDGMWVRKPQLVHCTELGKGMARMHLAGADFAIKRPNSLSVDGWAPLLDASRERAHEVKTGLAEELSAELEELQALWPRDLPSGVIHADLFPDNVFYLGKDLSGLIDFYFACNDALAYDVAICINAWCFEHDGMFNVTKARALLEGYRSVRPFSALEFDNLPLLCRGAALRFLLTRLYDWLSVPEGALVVPKNPLEYLHKLRFHRGVENASAYGLDK